MAGHSKFKNIQHRKGAQDKKRALHFSKLAREITAAARTGKPDPDSNPRLRAAIQTARAANMPKDNIERARAKGRDPGGGNYEPVRYEGFGPEGIGVIVETLTDNRNRTSASLRSIFSRHGGSLGESNAVAFLFEQIGEIVYPDRQMDSDAALEAALEAGAQDCLTGDRTHAFLCPPAAVHETAGRLESALGAPPSSIRLAWRPREAAPCSEDARAQLGKILAELEENDDVQHVYAATGPLGRAGQGA